VSRWAALFRAASLRASGDTVDTVDTLGRPEPAAAPQSVDTVNTVTGAKGAGAEGIAPAVSTPSPEEGVSGAPPRGGALLVRAAGDALAALAGREPDPAEAAEREAIAAETRGEIRPPWPQDGWDSGRLARRRGAASSGGPAVSCAPAAPHRMRKAAAALRQGLPASAPCRRPGRGSRFGADAQRAWARHAAGGRTGVPAGAPTGRAGGGQGRSGGTWTPAPLRGSRGDFVAPA
jgi:translation initiation factor IF-2